jgi:hypothetical protein
MSSRDWDRLIESAPTLPIGESLATTDSLWASFRAGRASAAQLVAATVSFAGNGDADAAADNGYRWKRWSDSGFLGEGERADLSELIRRAYHEKLTALGFNPRSGAYAAEDPNHSKMRSEIVGLLAMVGGSNELRKALEAAARAYLQGNEEALDPSYYSLAFEVYLQAEGTSAGAQLYDRMIGSENAALREAALTALGTSGEPPIGALMLDKLNDPRLVDMERVEVLTDLLSRSRTRPAALTWLQGKLWKGDERADQTLWEAAVDAPACSFEDAAIVKRLITPAVAQDPRNGLELGRQLETIRDCAALRTARGEEVSKALKAFSETHHDH